MKPKPFRAWAVMYGAKIMDLFLTKSEAQKPYGFDIKSYSNYKIIRGTFVPDTKEKK